MGTNSQDVQRTGAPASRGDTVYALGMIGAWVYFWRKADTPRDRVLGVLKGLVWPAFLVHEAFSVLAHEGGPKTTE
jgi:hypothetical protein